VTPEVDRVDLARLAKTCSDAVPVLSRLTHGGQENDRGATRFVTCPDTYRQGQTADVDPLHGWHPSRLRVQAPDAQWSFATGRKDALTSPRPHVYPRTETRTDSPSFYGTASVHCWVGVPSSSSRVSHRRSSSPSRPKITNPIGRARPESLSSCFLRRRCGAHALAALERSSPPAGAYQAGRNRPGTAIWLNASRIAANCCHRTTGTDQLATPIMVRPAEQLRCSSGLILGSDTGPGNAKVPVVAAILVLLRDKHSNEERHFAGATYNEACGACHHL